jgi:hypothetical protein
MSQTQMSEASPFFLRAGQEGETIQTYPAVTGVRPHLPSSRDGVTYGWVFNSGDEPSPPSAYRFTTTMEYRRGGGFVAQNPIWT